MSRHRGSENSHRCYRYRGGCSKYAHRGHRHGMHRVHRDDWFFMDGMFWCTTECKMEWVSWVIDYRLRYSISWLWMRMMQTVMRIWAE